MIVGVCVINGRKKNIKICVEKFGKLKNKLYFCTKFKKINKNEY